MAAIINLKLDSVGPTSQAKIEGVHKFLTYFNDSIRRAVIVRATFAAAADPPRKSDSIDLDILARRMS